MIINYKNKSTGQLSFLVTAMTFGGPLCLTHGPRPESPQPNMPFSPWARRGGVSNQPSCHFPKSIIFHDGHNYLPFWIISIHSFMANLAGATPPILFCPPPRTSARLYTTFVEVDDLALQLTMPLGSAEAVADPGRLFFGVRLDTPKKTSKTPRHFNSKILETINQDFWSSFGCVLRMLNWSLVSTLMLQFAVYRDRRPLPAKPAPLG